MGVCASREKKSVKTIWDSIPKQKDGKVSPEDFGRALNTNVELWQLCKDSGLDDMFIFDQLDINGDDTLDYDEFKGQTAVMGNLHDLFKGMDTNKSGSLSKKELAKELNVKNSSLLAMCEAVGLDTKFYIKEQMANEDGTLTWESFRDTFAGVASLVKEFQKIDKSNNGKISKKELAKALEKNPKLRKKIGKAGINTDFFIKEQMANEDGQVTFKEFYKLLKKPAA